MAGQVIGIASSILTKSEGFEGQGFVVTSNTASRLLLEQPPFWFGLDGIVLEDELAAAFNLPQPTGFLVQQVAENSPRRLNHMKPGDIITVKVLRAGRILQLSATRGR